MLILTIFFEQPAPDYTADVQEPSRGAIPQKLRHHEFYSSVQKFGNVRTLMLQKPPASRLIDRQAYQRSYLWIRTLVPVLSLLPAASMMR